MRRSRSLGAVCAMSAPAGASSPRAASAIEKDAKRRDMTIPDDGGLMVGDASTSVCPGDPRLSTAGSCWTIGRARNRTDGNFWRAGKLLGQAVGGDEADRAGLAG